MQNRRRHIFQTLYAGYPTRHTLSPEAAITGSRFMQGKTVVITGATSGIGQVAALALAKMGARVVFVARDASRAEATLTRLRAANPQEAHSFHLADLSEIAGMKQSAAAIAADAPKIDVLINNAGAMFGARRETADGLERTFATNHLAYFVLTNLLLAPLRAAGAARVVSTSSMAHQGMTLDFDDLQGRKRYFAYAAYGKSKLCNILFTRELARRLEGTTVTANCLHPGFVATRFADSSDGWLRSLFQLGKRLMAISPENGARTILYLATAPAVAGKSGGYYVKSKPAALSAAAKNDADAKRLWAISAALTGVG